MTRKNPRPPSPSHVTHDPLTHPPNPDTQTQTTTPEQLHQIPLTLIDLGDQMIRHAPDADDIVELAADIARRGLLQPIGVSPAATDRYQLRWGSRRLAAHIRLTRTHILARITTASPTEVKGTALAENLQRKQLTIGEEIDAVSHLHDVDKLSPAQIADSCGKDRSWVLRRLALRGLPHDVGRALIEETISISAAEVLATLTDTSARNYVLSQAIACRLNLTAIRAMVTTFTDAPSITTAVEAGIATAQATHEPHTIFIACQTCATPTLPAHLAILRLCPTCLTIINTPDIRAILTEPPTPTTPDTNSTELQ
jgi:ParB/RepB/Spo0J family partition protein